MKLTRRFSRLTLWNKIGAVGSVASVVALIWALAARPSPVGVVQNPNEVLARPASETLVAVPRPYVVITAVQLVLPTDRSQPIQVVFDLKNTGQTEAVGSLCDFTYYFSVDPQQREFAYQHSQRTSFTLAPAEQWRGHFLPSFVLSDQKLKTLNSGVARLFIYARGEYRDASGKTYNLPFARMYHPVVSGLLAVPPDDIVFR